MQILALGNVRACPPGPGFELYQTDSSIFNVYTSLRKAVSEIECKGTIFFSIMQDLLVRKLLFLIFVKETLQIVCSLIFMFVFSTKKERRNALFLFILFFPDVGRDAQDVGHDRHVQDDRHADREQDAQALRSLPVFPSGLLHSDGTCRSSDRSPAI